MSRNEEVVKINIIPKLDALFGIKIDSIKPLYSYYGGVYEVITADESYILKVIRFPDAYKAAHMEAEIAFCQRLNAVNELKLVSQEYIPSAQGEILQRIDDMMYYLIRKHDIISHETLTTDQQKRVGKLMKYLHSLFEHFTHPGLSDSSWMRELDEEEWKYVVERFDTTILTPEEIREYTQPLDYETLGLSKTVIHGDWHGSNFSWTEPPFLYDLDTLCYGSPLEEIARTITHWDAGVDLRTFLSNILEGYGDISNEQRTLIPKFAIAICLKQFFEISQYGDPEGAEHFEKLVAKIRDELHLN